jgi:hypothetical protein
MCRVARKSVELAAQLAHHFVQFRNALADSAEVIGDPEHTDCIATGSWESACVRVPAVRVNSVTRSGGGFMMPKRSEVTVEQRREAVDLSLSL